MLQAGNDEQDRPVRQHQHRNKAVRARLVPRQTRARNLKLKRARFKLFPPPRGQVPAVAGFSMIVASQRGPRNAAIVASTTRSLRLRRPFSAFDFKFIFIMAPAPSVFLMLLHGDRSFGSGSRPMQVGRFPVVSHCDGVRGTAST